MRLASSALALSFVLACGGESSVDKAGTGGGGGSGSSAAGSGGKGSGGDAAGGAAAGGGRPAGGGSAGIAGGISGSGGGVAGSGGTAASGGMSGGAGVSGTGGAGFELPTCLLPLVTGPCNAAFDAWGYDPATARCVQFLYGGCSGNANRFESQQACDDFCTAAYPQDCAEAERRPVGCPCTSEDQCNCSSAAYELGGSCAPSGVGLCDESLGEGNCSCRLSGESVCGV